MAHMNPRALVLVAGLTAASLPATAFAQDTRDSAEYLTGGALVTFGSQGTGLGAEANYTSYPDRHVALGVSGFLQFQFYLDGSWRVGVGASANLAPFGAELGLAWRSGNDEHDGTLGVHIAPFLSTGFISAAYRATIPLSSTPRAWHTEHSATLGFKYILRLNEGGDTFAPYGCIFDCSVAVSGRPLVEGDRLVTAALTDDRAWSGDVTPHARDASVAALWSSNARYEHASIAAFARLALQLMAVGAPPALLAQTHAAASDEVDHAQRCAAMAARYGGSPVSFDALAGALAPIAARDLAGLAVDALLEGCLGEGTAARMAREGSRTATDADVRATLSRIADDETRHAELAWSVIDWCLARGGDTVRDALDEALRTMPSVMRTPDEAPLYDALDARTLADHGFVSVMRQRALWKHTRREALRRLTRGRRSALAA